MKGILRLAVYLVLAMIILGGIAQAQVIPKSY